MQLFTEWGIVEIDDSYREDFQTGAVKFIRVGTTRTEITKRDGTKEYIPR